MERVDALRKAKNAIMISKTPFYKHERVYKYLSDESAIQLYSVDRKTSPHVQGKSYTEHKNGITQRKEMFFSDAKYDHGSDTAIRLQRLESSVDNRSELHLLHLKNVYVVRHIGIITEDDHVLSAFFNGYFRATSMSYTQEGITLTQKRIAAIYARGDIPVIGGNCFYGNFGNHGHGHLLEEFIPRLWCDTCEELPPLDYIVTSYDDLFSYEDVLRPFPKFSKADLLVFQEAVFCKNLYVPTQALRHYYKMSEVVSNVWQKIGGYYKALIQNTPFSKCKKIYISRSKDAPNRKFESELFVEELLKRQGYLIIHPGYTSLALKLSLCANAKGVATPFGSAMIHMCCSLENASLFVIAPFNEFWPIRLRSLIPIPSNCDLEIYLGEDTEVKDDHARAWDVTNQPDLGKCLLQWDRKLEKLQ